MSILKICGGCGASLTKIDWELLPLKGYMSLCDPENEDKELELRNCKCGSTISIEVLKKVLPLANPSKAVIGKE